MTTDYKCNVCSTAETPLVKMVVLDQDERPDEVWICMKHLFMKMLDTGMKEMHNNMQDYTGVLFDYKDEFKT